MLYCCDAEEIESSIFESLAVIGCEREARATRAWHLNDVNCSSLA